MYVILRVDYSGNTVLKDKLYFMNSSIFNNELYHRLYNNRKLGNIKS